MQPLLAMPKSLFSPISYLVFSLISACDATIIGDGCYWISVGNGQKRKWRNARDKCIDRGGTLIKIEDKTEDEVIIDHLGRYLCKL